MAMKKRLNARFCAIITVSIILLGAFNVYAYLTTSVSIPSNGQITRDVYAASGSASNIQAAINLLGSSSGNVHVPAGTWNWTSNDGVIVYGGVNVIGASLAGCQGHENNWASNIATTVIHKNSYNFQTELFSVDGSNGKFTRISGIQFECDPVPVGQSDDNYCVAISAFKMQGRVDHCTFINFNQFSFFISDAASSGALSKVLLDHDVVNLPYKQSGSGWVWGYGFYAQGRNIWDADATKFFGHWDDFPTNFPLMYVEDCHFSLSRHAVDAIQGGYFVIRYCRIDNPYPENYGEIDIHGSMTSGSYSGRGFEAYNNTINGDGNLGDSQAICIRQRGGASLIFNNTFTGGIQYSVYLTNQDDTANNHPDQHVKSTYIWGNTATSGTMVGTDGSYAQNVDYFLRAPNQGQDSFIYTPYIYPHPLTLTGS